MFVVQHLKPTPYRIKSDLVRMDGQITADAAVLSAPFWVFCIAWVARETPVRSRKKCSCVSDIPTCKRTLAPGSSSAWLAVLSVAKCLLVAFLTAPRMQHPNLSGTSTVLADFFLTRFRKALTF